MTNLVEALRKTATTTARIGAGVAAGAALTFAENPVHLQAQTADNILKSPAITRPLFQEPTTTVNAHDTSLLPKYTYMWSKDLHVLAQEKTANGQPVFVTPVNQDAVLSESVSVTKINGVLDSATATFVLNSASSVYAPIAGEALFDISEKKGKTDLIEQFRNREPDNRIGKISFSVSLQNTPMARLQTVGDPTAPRPFTFSTPELSKKPTESSVKTNAYTVDVYVAPQVLQDKFGDRVAEKAGDDLGILVTPQDIVTTSTGFVPDNNDWNVKLVITRVNPTGAGATEASTNPDDLFLSSDPQDLFITTPDGAIPVAIRPELPYVPLLSTD